MLEYNERYYIKKVRPFIINNVVYYEITFTLANNNTSKFERVIAFTKCNILEYYAVKLKAHKSTINIFSTNIDVIIIDDYDVSIRPCELKNFAKILGFNYNFTSNSIEYKYIMSFLKQYRISLVDLLTDRSENYVKLKLEIRNHSKNCIIIELLDKCKDLINDKKQGINIIRYLLLRLNNKIIKLQYSKDSCNILSGLNLKYGCIPFEQMPYCTSLIGHNPSIFDLVLSVSDDNREHELIARYVKNRTEIDGVLFVPIDELNQFSDIDELINKYNNYLYIKHQNRRIEHYFDYIYIKEYAECCSEIIIKLKQLSSSGVENDKESIESWLNSGIYSIDDENKVNIIKEMFVKSHVALIYGSAGTGKTTLLKHIANFWVKNKKIFLANTNSAVDNMKRRVNVINSEYYTIASFAKNCNISCDVLVIDECSTVSNIDMVHILNNVKFKLLILAGDIYQIESIRFGNWFNIAKRFVSQASLFELLSPYRAKNDNLILLWDRVRNLEDGIQELMVKYKYVTKLSEEVFEKFDEDEIILCLNYDGPFGINSINKYLQKRNTNNELTWGINQYKIGDPILFNESNPFLPLIYNNCKGKIVDIKSDKNRILFNVELPFAINEIEASNYNFTLAGSSDNGNSIISFSVDKFVSDDFEDDDISSVVPFQVAYAISIHKAQGLEYESVKVIITNENEERITHNIFYTAITRAMSKLKVFWSPETENYILHSFTHKDYNRDIQLISKLYNLSIT